MSGEVEKCPILHVRPKFDVFTLFDKKRLSVHRAVFFVQNFVAFPSKYYSNICLFFV